MLMKGQVVLIKVAGQRIGVAIVKGCTRHGAGVVMTDIDIGNAQITAEAITGQGGDACAYARDVADTDACTTLAAEAGSALGDVTTVLNSAFSSVGEKLTARTFGMPGTCPCRLIWMGR